MIKNDLKLPDGRTVLVHDSGDSGAVAEPGLVVVWLHGSPGTGGALDPMLAAATERGIRLLSYDRPGYGGSTRHTGRDVASAAADVAAITEALALDRFAVLGHSGGAPHALACGALLPDRVVGVAALSGLAPLSADGLDWFAGMWPASEGELRAAVAGRAALEAHLATSDFDPDLFTSADHDALGGPWSSLGANAGAASAGDPGGLVDDNLAFVGPWGFAPGEVTVPVLVGHGGQDRIVPSAHGRWLAEAIGSAELWLSQDDGHVSVLGRCAAAMDWLGERAARH